MLVLGYQSEDNSVYSHELDVDPDIDSPRKIHDLLKKKAKGQDFTSIVCVQDDVVVATFLSEEDFDLTEPAEEDDSLDEDDDDTNPDGLHDDDEDDDDSDDDE